jgi:hypothetical protein
MLGISTASSSMFLQEQQQQQQQQQFINTHSLVKSVLGGTPSSPASCWDPQIWISTTSNSMFLQEQQEQQQFINTNSLVAKMVGSYTHFHTGDLNCIQFQVLARANSSSKQ